MSNVLLIDGFDMYNGTGTNTGLQGAWLNLVGAGGLSMVTGRFGGQALQVAAAGGADRRVQRSFAAQTTFSFGFAYQSSTANAYNLGATLVYLTAGATAQLSLSLNANNQLQACRMSGPTSRTVLGTVTTPLSNGVWYYIECEITVNGSTGVFNIYLNGTQVLNLTGQNTANSGTTVDTLSLGNSLAGGGSGGGATPQFDDLYVSDSATRLGECKVETLRPNADTATKHFTPDSGTANFSRVNETLVDGDTSYVQDGTVGDRDLYAIGSLSSTPTSIFAVNVVSFATKTDGTTRTMYNSCQSSGTDSDGSAFPLAVGYMRNDRILQTDPNGGGAWTASRVNGLLIGPKVAS